MAPIPTRTALGEALVQDLGVTSSVYYRQPDGQIARGRPVSLAVPATSPLRYGIPTWSDVKGNLVGEAFVADKVLDVLRHPSNPFNLARNATYNLTQKDRDDLKFMAVGGRPAYEHVLRMHEQLFGGTPPPVPQPRPLPAPLPKPTSQPSPQPAPSPIPPPGQSSLEVRVEELRSYVYDTKAGIFTPFAALLPANSAKLFLPDPWHTTRVFAIAGLRLYRAALAFLERP